MTTWKTEVEKIKQCAQSDEETLTQLEDLHHIANKLGFYDAGDVIGLIVDENKNKGKDK